MLLGCVKIMQVKRCLITIIILIGVISYTLHNRPKTSFDTGIKWENIKPNKEEALCLEFLQKSMNFDNGIYTNYLDDEDVKDWATGHQVLSESEGLIMLYLVQKGDKILFDKHFDIVKDMILDDGVIMWRMGKEGDILTKSSATIDDLRIIRALIFAKERWNDDKYKKMLDDLIYKVKTYEVVGQNLVDYYEAESKTMAKTINLSYIDLYTMKLLAQKDENWKGIYKSGMAIIKNGRVSDDGPFFWKCYNYDTKEYSSEDITNIIDYLKILLHLSEVGICPDFAIDWLKQQIKVNDALFNEYYTKSAKPATTLQSSAAYAITCRIAININDEKLYELMKKKLLEFQISETSSFLYGAFGNLESQEVYSFDNLQALLALQRFGGLNYGKFK